MGCASSKEPDNGVQSRNDPFRTVTELRDVRQLISSDVKDDVTRRKLLQLAGKSPQAWNGCQAKDVVGVLMEELVDQEKEEELIKTTVTGSVDPPPVQAVHISQPAVVQYTPAPGVPSSTQAAPQVSKDPAPTHTVHHVVHAPPSTVYIREPMAAPRPGLGSAILTGVVAGRVAGRTAARRRRC
ncbi:hypothetical protein WJX73_001216 [Symbiochloris irregularis]|uniref:Uncharacterized protein n=1 Tax=Symbiochloris irregularis TaxID=706552 RepID=A0AAW1NQP1_9CHLO